MRRADAPATVWIRGRGPDADALARLRDHFRRPGQVMGEAWFLGEVRRTYPELRGDLSLLDANTLKDILYEATSGTTSFGVSDEWSNWFHYLLAHLVPRGLEPTTLGRLLESLVSGVVAHYPQDLAPEPYRGFRDDVLATLGRCLMAPEAWDAHGPRRGAILHDGAEYWYEPSGDFAASAFLHAKYLDAGQIAPWVRSMLDLPGPFWQAQVLAWLAGLRPMLDGVVNQPAQWRQGGDPSWEASHVLHGFNDGDHRPGRAPPPSTLPAANRAALVAAVRRDMTVERLCAWLDGFKPHPTLHERLYGLPSRFAQLYLET